MRGAARADFRRAAELGVGGYPTLLAVTDDRLVPLARGTPPSSRSNWPWRAASPRVGRAA